MNSKTHLQQLDILLKAENGDEESGLAFERERFLVAWVLLTRLSEDHLDSAWEEHGEKLGGFARKLLILGRTSDSEMFICYVRLVARVVALLTRFPSEVGKCLMSAWRDACSRNVNSIALNVDMCNALLSWLEGAPSDQTQILNNTWDVFSSVSPRLKTVVPTSERTGRTQRGSSGDEANSFAEQTMKELLNSISVDPNATDQEYTKDNWGRLVLGMFELYAVAAPEDLVRKVLFWMSEHHQEQMLSQQLRFGWHEWLMTYVGENIVTYSKSSLLHEPKAMEIMQKILLAHAVFPDERALRAMAWQTINAIVHSYGWEKCSKKSSTKCALCVWTHLASGEWKIRLEEDDDFLSAATRRPILEGCGRLLISVVQYLANFDERPDRPIHLDADAIVHLHQSLQESLIITSEYLNSRSSICDIDPIIVQLWSHLFSEIDVASLRTPEPIIACLQRRLTESGDDLILCDVANLLIAAQSDQKARAVALRLQGFIFTYLEIFWHTLSEPRQRQRWLRDDVPFACTCTKFSVSARDIPSPVNLRDLTRTMTQALQILVGYLETNRISLPDRDQLLSNLQLVIESYLAIMTQASLNPTDHQSMVVSRAIGLCSRK